jgi:hypothetical protein
MPKDRTKNIDRYKIRGGALNEFEFERNSEEAKQATKNKKTTKTATTRGASAKKLAARKAANKK